MWKSIVIWNLPLPDEAISGRTQSIIKTGLIQDSPILNTATGDNKIRNGQYGDSPSE